MRRTWVARILALSIALALLIAPTVAFADPDSGDTSETIPGSTAPTAPTAPTATGGVTAVMPTPAPVVVVRSYATAPARVTPGTEFDLTLTLYNATSRRADNLVVSLGQTTPTATGTAATATGGLTVLGTGNAKYVGLLKGKTEDTVTFRVIVTPGTPPGALTVPVTVSFEHQGARQEVGYTLGVLVERDAVLSLVTAELPEMVMVGETFDASFEVANASTYALSGVTLSVEASGAQIFDGTYFLGTMDAATTEGLDVQITPEVPGDLEVVFVVSYRDDFGRPQEYRETRTVTVEDSPEPGEIEEGTEIPEDETGEDNWFVSFFKALFGLGS
ncbi:MAG: hypothetical protein Q7W51_04450 [Coriobacteriia bacterium]|nr:hypothetical protein [Coriobacteriia bacterium]